MGLRLRHVPTRLATGAFILNAGITKMSADNATAESTLGMAVSTYPFLASLDPQRFVRVLAVGEIALGAGLLTPFIPSRLAGAGLSLFSATLLAMYVRMPAMRRDRSMRPSRQGTALAKDVWMLGIGLSLVID